MSRSSHTQHDDAAAFADGELVPSVDFDFDAIDSAIPDDSPILARAEELNRTKQQEDTIRLLQWLTSGTPSLAEVGRRTLTLRHYLRPETTQKKLAARCGITEAALSMRMTKLRRLLSSRNQN